MVAFVPVGETARLPVSKASRAAVIEVPAAELAAAASQLFRLRPRRRVSSTCFRRPVPAAKSMSEPRESVRGTLADDPDQRVSGQQAHLQAGRRAG
jgi:hypothetical protein